MRFIKSVSMIAFSVLLTNPSYVSASDLPKETDESEEVEKISKQVTELKIKEDSKTGESSVVAKPIGGGIGYRLTNYAFTWRSPEIEMAKFFTLTLNKLLEFIEEDDDYESIVGKYFAYKTGDKEGASNFYEGYLIFDGLEYGKANHKFISPQQGWQPSPDEVPLQEKLKPHAFIKPLVQKMKLPTTFLKGTPTKDDLSKTNIVYVMYSESGTRYVRVKAHRDTKIDDL
ncbi:hypothetical protein [Candidatus Nucleicultrix amoebiphila]|uniref:Uncharacterized protein n=1 Tax=Candidatus Nucleicultrix amoebiphila FS5 TaxID=1414854 RepID=A0A1W6N639_9PROT|nr:hypothetical protein [Candidatus Nucleicultrix amoebiphila]ARN85196.1 hypothetical protein GQ61_07770 [Candidatus Nucleicultrix amoebiphila FS5]